MYIYHVMFLGLCQWHHTTSTTLWKPECHIQNYSDHRWGGWAILRVICLHPLLPGAVQALGRCIMDVNPQQYMPWGMATAPHLFNHLLNIRYWHTQPWWPRLGWIDNTEGHVSTSISSWIYTGFGLVYSGYKSTLSCALRYGNCTTSLQPIFGYQILA